MLSLHDEPGDATIVAEVAYDDLTVLDHGGVKTTRSLELEE